ncbi:MAG: sensor histidine kinase [Acidimicrobiales bacterium]
MSTATRRQLFRLRLRLTILIATLVALAVAVLGVVVVRTDRRLRDEQIDAELLRRADQLGRSVAFVDGELLLDGSKEDFSGEPIAMGLRPRFTVADLPGFEDYAGEFARLDGPARQHWIVAVFEDLGPPHREEILAPYRPDGGEAVSAEELVHEMLADPPPALSDEAFRRYAVFRAGQEGVPLESRTRLLIDAPPFADDQVIGLLDQVIDGGLRDTVDPSWSSGYLARGVPVRDGAEVRGAAVAFLDPSGFEAAHRELRDRSILAATMTVAVAALGAWFVAGRSIEPAARALAQQERFVADAAHELRNPVAAIRATAERGLGVDGAPDLALRRVAEIASDTSLLTDNLLTLARMDADRLPLDRRPVRLDLLVEQVTADHEGVVLEVGESTVVADPVLVARAIDNLIRNAVAHGGAGEPARVRVEVGDGRVVVSDDGPGIPPEQLDTIFDRFRSGGSSKGHGLGLALTRWVAGAHGGEVTAANRPGGGAVFTLELPIHDGPGGG